jgi:hypothetical protein
MLRRVLYIVFLLLLSARPSHLYAATCGGDKALIFTSENFNTRFITMVDNSDTSKVKRPPQNRMDILDHSTIKEVPKTKRQPKPEKITTPVDTADNKKPRSKRRPDGVERPPDIIRRNN